MPRKLRVEYPGAMCQLVSRGDWRGHIYLEDVDRQGFINTLAEARQKRGWQVHHYCLMPGKMEGKLGEHHFRELQRETARAKAEWITAEEVRRPAWTETELATWRKSDPAKLAIGARLRQETTLSIKAIAAGVHLGTSKGADAKLHKWMRRPAPPDSGQEELAVRDETDQTMGAPFSAPPTMKGKYAQAHRD